jgi:hypothetical protein
MRLEAVVVRTDVVDDAEGMRQAGAAYFFDTYAQGDTLSAFFKLTLDLQCGFFSQCHGHG